jgi:ATP-dependent Clp protease ATP-binding subunit ClpA
MHQGPNNGNSQNGGDSELPPEGDGIDTNQEISPENTSQDESPEEEGSPEQASTEDKSEDSAVVDTDGDPVADDLMSALPAEFRDAIERASHDGNGVILVTNGGFPEDLLSGQNADDAIDARKVVQREIDSYEAERQHVKEFILPTIDHQIDRLERRRDAIKDQYDLGATSDGIDFSKMGPELRAELKERVLAAQENLPKKVKGQQQAIDPLISSLKRAVTGTRDVNRPITSVLEVGRTGVGKTLLAKSLAEELSSDEGLSFGFMKIDCSEFSAGHEGARLTGAPPGYIGHDQGGQFEAIGENPFHVVLFDEIEKGSQELHNMLLQILEDGEVTLGSGQKVNFKNCVVMMTSNVGVGDLDKALNPIGYTTEVKTTLTDQEILQHTSEALKRAFAPEFLNRLDGIIPFNDLSEAVAREIADLEVAKVVDRAMIANDGCVVGVAAAMIDAVVEEGFSPEYGAREVRRAVQRMLEEPLADEMFELDFATLASSEFSVTRIDGKTLIRRKDQHVPIPSLDSEPFDSSDSMGFLGASGAGA